MVILTLTAQSVTDTVSDTNTVIILYTVAVIKGPL